MIGERFAPGQSAAVLAPGGRALYITFESDGLGFAVRMDEVERVTPLGNLRRLRGMMPWVVGVLIHRGAVVGVVDPARVAGRSGGCGKQLLILHGAPGLAVLAEKTDAVTQDFAVERRTDFTGSVVPGMSQVLRSRSRTYSLLETESLRAHLGARGGRDGEQDPARG